MDQNKLLFDQDMSEPESLEFSGFRTVVFSKRCQHSKVNQDSIGIFAPSKKTLVMCLADGAGGHKNGGEASKYAIEEFSGKEESLKDPKQRRLEILESFENANNKIIDNLQGAATTLVVAGVENDRARFYFAGDSIALVIGGRGKLKYRTWGHNPVDMGIQAGILSADTYDNDDLRHVVTNIMGLKQLHIECSVSIDLDPRDTVLLCSDGLYDNIKVDEICEIIADKDINEAAVTLAELALKRMNSEKPEFSKYDDLSFVLYQKK